MLLRFGVANHRSIRDYQELFLSASKRIRHEGLVIPVPTLKEAAVPVAAIYGSNASGKSNLIDAMDEIQRAIVRSHMALGATDDIPRYPFQLDDESATKPTRFDCTFTVGDRGADERGTNQHESVYEYGFEYTDTEFRHEWLYRVVRKERQSTHVLFDRRTEDGQVHVSFGSQLRGENRVIANLTRPNSLFLSAAAQNNHPQLTNLYRYFAERWTVIPDDGAMTDVEVADRLSSYKHTEHLLFLITQADLGITGFSIEYEDLDDDQAEIMRDIVGIISKRLSRSDEGRTVTKNLLDRIRHRKRLRFIHSTAEGEPPEFDYEMESKGTRALTSLLIPALEALFRGSLLVIDELDTSLHPYLARAFMSLFTKVDANLCGAQLVFSTHDLTLLGSEELKQDEIWIANKDLEGTSQFTPLTEYKLRSRDDLEKAYRQGRLGGVPDCSDFITDFDRGDFKPAP